MRYSKWWVYGVLIIVAQDQYGATAQSIRLSHGNRERPSITHFVEEGTFTVSGVNYRVSYDLNVDSHLFGVMVNGRQALASVARADFVRLDTSSIRMTTRGDNKTLDVTIDLSGPVEGCNNPGTARDALILSFKDKLTIWKWTHKNCLSKLENISYTSSVNYIKITGARTQ